MFKIIVILFKGASCIIRRINIDAFYSPCKLLFKSFEGKQIVAVNQHISGVRVSIILGSVVQENARFYLRIFSFSPRARTSERMGTESIGGFVFAIMMMEV